MTIRRASLSWAIVIAGFPVAIAFAQPSGGGAGGHPIPESERWATITHPGNEPYQAPFPGLRFPVGRVDYEYQISRTEVTGSEWFEFVQAYGSYVDPDYANATEFTSQAIARIGPGEYFMAPGAANRSIAVGWRYAARYVNWLHNDKANTREAFESGAYDTSTFGDVFGEFSEFTDQITHSPGARYWLPTLDELIKAFHFDPDRHGEGMPGYWLYPTSSDVPPVGGPPELGGQTSADYFWGLFGAPPRPDVAAYRDVMSPWGLWDASGGEREWSETAAIGIGRPLPGGRWVEGTSWRDIGAEDVAMFDSIDYAIAPFPHNSYGIRIARTVPGAGGAGLFGCVLMFVGRRRR